MRRLLPDPAPITIEEQLDAYEPWLEAFEERPLVAMNFVATVDGRATIGGVSGPIGSDTDTAMLAWLRTRFDALMIGAGTMRAERYGPPVPKAEKRGRRERLGLPPDPLMVIVSASLELPWEAQLFADANSRVLVFTSSDAQPPETEASLRVVRHEGGAVDLGAALRELREEHGVRALLSEGGPRIHAEMQAAGLVDELFLTTSPKLSGGAAPRIVEGELAEVMALELAWLLEEDGELFARYRRAR